MMTMHLIYRDLPILKPFKSLWLALSCQTLTFREVPNWTTCFVLPLQGLALRQDDVRRLGHPEVDHHHHRLPLPLAHRVQPLLRAQPPARRQGHLHREVRTAPSRGHVDPGDHCHLAEPLRGKGILGQLLSARVVVRRKYMPHIFFGECTCLLYFG